MLILNKINRVWLLLFSDGYLVVATQLLLKLKQT